MIKKIRSIARGIGSKILMALLVLTFGVWGIGDVVNQSGGNTAVATVGDVKISANEYQRALYFETEKLRRLLGKQFSPEFIENSGVKLQVLQQIVDNRLLVLESKKMGLRVSDEDVANNIRKNPSFLDEKGKFSKKIFEAMIHTNGQTEKDYIQQIREDMAVKLLLTSLASITSIPENAASTLLATREEQRTVDVYTISSTLVGSVLAPSEKQLKEYYEAHISEFAAPEYRTLSYVAITADNAKKSAKSPDKNHKANNDIETVYHERIEEFRKPQRREVEQLLFSDESSARKAYDELQSGKSFEQVAKSSNILNPKAISLGLVEKSNILEVASEKVFSMGIDTVSEPIKSSFGWHIFLVKEIIPATTLSLEEVRSRLEKDLEQQANENALNELSNKLEDAIAGGGTLVEAAKELDLKIITLPPIDKNGALVDGTLEKTLPKDIKFLEAAFKAEEKTETSLITAKNGSNYMVRVEGITQSRVRPLEEVKSKLASEWTEQEKKQKLSDLEKKIAANFATISTRANAIKTYALSPSTLTISQKQEAAKKLPEAMVKDIFSRPVGSSTVAFAQENDTGYAIAVIKEIIAAKHDEKNPKYIANLANVSTEYKNSMQNEIIEQYLRFLATKYPITVNADALKKTKSDE